MRKQDTLVRLILRHLPEDTYPEVVRAFQVATLMGNTNAADCFLAMVREYLGTYEHRVTKRGE